MTYFCWFWLFCWRQHDNMIIYSFYVWFFNSSYWVLPVLPKFHVYMTSLSKVIEGGWIPPPPPDIWDPKSPGLIGLKVTSTTFLTAVENVSYILVLQNIYFIFSKTFVISHIKQLCLWKFTSQHPFSRNIESVFICLCDVTATTLFFYPL